MPGVNAVLVFAVNGVTAISIFEHCEANSLRGFKVLIYDELFVGVRLFLIEHLLLEHRFCKILVCAGRLNPAGINSGRNGPPENRIFFEVNLFANDGIAIFVVGYLLVLQHVIFETLHEIHLQIVFEHFFLLGL